MNPETNVGSNNIPPPNQENSPEMSPTKSTTAFKARFFAMVRSGDSPQKIQNLLISSRKILNEKLILHLYLAQPKLYPQFRYLLLALSLTLDRKEEYSIRWGTYYEITNQILKMPNQHRLSTSIETHLINFTYFLIDSAVTTFFTDFKESLDLIQSTSFNATFNRNEEENVLFVKRIVRIFNSLLCLKFVMPVEYIKLIYHFGLRSKNYVEFLVSIQDKFVKRLGEYDRDQKQQINSLTLDVQKVYLLTNIFYDTDPEYKLRQLVSVQANSVSQNMKIEMKEIVSQLSQIENKKPNKNQVVHYDKMLKFILKQILKNKTLKTSTKKQFIIECFHQIQDIDEEFFDYLLQTEGNEEDEEVSSVLAKVVERQSLRFITVSRIKSILKRFTLSKTISYSSNIKKMFRILRLLYWLAKKFNQANPTYMMKLDSSIKISNLSKAMMIIFCVDFREAQVGRIIQFEVNKIAFDILIKYSENQDNCTIEVITQVDGQQKLKQKKEIGKWSYILCMIGLCEKKTISLFIDGACFKLPLNDTAKEITNVEFGPFSGSIKDVYILDKVYEMHEINKGYFQKFRKMDLLLEELGQKSFIFTFEKGKVSEQSKWFWKKEMSVEYEKVQKVRSISFSEGIEQVGGLPSLLFLATRIITSEKSEDLVNFLIDFVEFLKLLINQTESRVAEKWILNSTIYFGQFLWLLLSKNEYLRGQKTFFNRIFDFFGCFFKYSPGQLIGNLRLAIISDIYLNFEIWSKCQTQIKLMLLNQISNKIENRESVILHEMFNRKDYEKIMSSLVFFFLQQNPSNDIESHFISGVKTSLVHDQISKIGGRFCELYTHEKVQNNSEVIRRDLLLIMSLINTFFQKDHLYFSQGELSVLAVLLSHISKNFTTLIVFEKTIDMQVYIFDHLTTLISNSPCQSELIFLLFELSFILLTGLENIKNGTALILDKFTLNGKRAEDTLEFSFKSTFNIIKNSRVLFDQSPAFSQEQVLSVLLGSLRSKGERAQQKQQKKLSYEIFLKQFEKFALAKLTILFSMIEFSMFVKECVEEKDIFPTACFFLKIIMKHQILIDAQPLVLNCFRMIAPFLRTNMQEKNHIGINFSEIPSSKIEPIQQKAEDMNQLNFQQQKSQEKTLYQNCISKLQQVFEQADLDLLLRTCKCPQLIEILITLKCFNPQKNRFVLPFNSEAWKKSRSSYGNALSSIIKLQYSFNSLELETMLSYLTSKKEYPNVQKQLKASQPQDILEKLLPLFIIFHTLTCISPDPQKLFDTDQQSIIVKCYQLMDIKSILRLYSAIKNQRSIIQNASKREEFELEHRINQLVFISQKLMEEDNKLQNLPLPYENQIIELKEKLAKNPQEIQTNTKYLKKILQEIKDIIENFQCLVQAFHKKPSLRNSPEKLQASTSALFRRRKTTESTKKGKILELNEPRKKQMYNEELKSSIKLICSKLQYESKRKEEAWRSLSNQNNFWVSSKIKNNECYEIHPKMTGFYRLNIVKTAFDEIPYPRRKSFEHQIEATSQPNEMESKLPSSQLIKNFMVEESSVNLTTVTENLPNNQAALKNDSRAPKDSIYAQYVTQRGVYAGLLFYNSQDQSFVFRCKGYSYLPKDNIVYQLSTIFHRIDDLQMKITIQTNHKTEVFTRRYIHRHTAIEIYSLQRSYFFNLFTKEVRDKFIKYCSNKLTTIADPRAEFQKRKYTERWMNGEFDNFEYLMLVNLFSGRTYNDLAQYPVMPWVITNYDPQQTQITKEFLKDEKNVRDLSKPSGKLNQKKFDNLKMRCNEIGEEDEESKFLYGTLYSNPTVIYSFFIRLQPFTTLHWEHQGRRIDHADRLFSAVRDQFSTVLSSTSDNKELVPQFYYWPEFLKNRNKVNLGIKQNKQEVHDVRLPGWAKNPEQFIFKMREVLQSPDVTRNIHNWIDLIFGYKNPKQVALEYDNLFHYRSYEHDIFLTEQSEQAIKGAQIAISQFGQIPFPLFLKPHPQRLLVSSQHFKLDKAILIKKQNNKRMISFQMNPEGFFIGYQNEVEYYSAQSPKILDITLEKPIRSYESEGTVIKNFDFANSIWFTLKDGTFRIYDKKLCMLEVDCEMECFNNFGKYIIYGYRSELVVCKIETNYKMTRISSLYGHKSNIYRIDTSVMLDVVVSVDRAGLVLVHEFSKLKLLREFELGPDLQVTDLCIHEMGYFIFFTKNQKLIIYTFLGELFLSQDIGITNKAITEQITKVFILEQDRSLLLFSTDKGKIYSIDFLQIKRFNQNCVYKEFSRFKNNILENCPRLGGTMGIKDFSVKKLPGKSVLTYKFYVLFENLSISCFYSAEQFQEKIKQNKMLEQLGLFTSSN